MAGWTRTLQREAMVLCQADRPGDRGALLLELCRSSVTRPKQVMLVALMSVINPS